MKILSGALMLLAVAGNMPCFGQRSDAKVFTTMKPLVETLTPLPINSIKPERWLKKQLQENLNGFTGHLDSLAPDLIIKDDIYGANRLSKNVKSKDVGALGAAGDWQVQFLWWNSETQSNWWDGYIRTAIITDSKKDLARIQSYVTKILATQDADGYIGIYDPALRYKFDNENGELWSKATLFRGLLAWAEYKGDKKVMAAVIRAVDNVLQNYPAGKSHPFYSKNPYVGGLSHGLAFTDVLEKLYHVTGQQRYRDYCTFLYQDFSEQVLHEDAQYAKLIDLSIPLSGHGVHTYEHLRSVAAAYYATGNPELKVALDNFLAKINKTTLPSGAPAGDEWILGRDANATSTGYEYCSLHELLDSYVDLFAKTGLADYGDKTERIFFNAAQGARHPSQSAICYLKTDNSYFLTGGRNGDSTDQKQTRYRYSPVHKEAAVCCVPNAGRIGPAYVQGMWMKNRTSLVATLLGPCRVTTSIAGTKVDIVEKTSYPFENQFELVVTVQKPVTFNLKFRKPAWATKVECSLPYKINGDFIEIDREWKNELSFTLRFDAEPQEAESTHAGYFFTYGALVLAHPIESRSIVTKQYNIAGLKEISYTSWNPVVYRGVHKPAIKSTSRPLYFETQATNPQTGATVGVGLVPMGSTILRQVTFELN